MWPFSPGQDTRFALELPGGSIVLGYDRTHPFVPNEAQRTDWQEHAAEVAGFGRVPRL